METRPRLLLVGGGHANVALLKAARRWTRQGARITLLTPGRYLWYSGMSPEYVGGVYAAEAARIDLLRLCLVNGAAFVPGRAVSVDTAARTVGTVTGEHLPYDLAVFDVGGLPADGERADGAVRVKPLSELRRLVAWLDESGGGHLVVVGGGAAGVEVLLNATARVRGHPGFGFTLLEPGPRLLGHFAPGLGELAGRRLRERGVDVRLNARAGQVEEGGVRLMGDERVPADLVLWATGTRGQAWLGGSGLPVDGKDRLCVTRTLQVPGHPRGLGAGDAVSVAGLDLDPSGVNAVKEGLHLRGQVGRLLRALSLGQAPEDVRLRPFRPYPASPYLVSTGTPEGWIALGPHLWSRGRGWLLLKHLADRVWMSRYHAPGEQQEQSVASQTQAEAAGQAG